MIEVLLKVLGAGLSIWESKEKRKYVDAIIRLKGEWYEEFNKPESDRSDATLDRIERELRDVGLGFAADVGASHAEVKP
jgi:hypothetical protein